MAMLVYQRVIPSKPGSIIPHGNQLTRLFLMAHVRSVLPSNWCHGVVLDPPSLGQEKNAKLTKRALGKNKPNKQQRCYMLYTICMFLLLYKMRMYIHCTEHIHVYTCKYTTYVCLFVYLFIYYYIYIYMQVYVCDDLISSMYLFIWFWLMMMMMMMMTTVMVTMTMM